MYTVIDNKLRFNDGVKIVGTKGLSRALLIPAHVTEIDFNEVEHIDSMFNLSHNKDMKHLDLGNVLSVKTIILPEGCSIKEKLYWAIGIYYNNGNLPENKIDGVRMKYINVYNYNSKPLVYLSGTIRGFLELRKEQSELLRQQGFAVYDPGNHITFGDPIADNNPDFVYKLDMKALWRADIILFDLNNLSAGTSAELGFVIALDWHKKPGKRVVVFHEKPITNFFIKGLIEEEGVEVYRDIKQFVKGR